MRRILLFSVLLVFGLSLRAQQVPELTLRAYHDLVYNPAIVGSKSNPQVKLHHRSQWVGFKGAPITDFLSYAQEFNFNMGLGGYIFRDQIGPLTNTGFNLAYAYHIPINRMYLSLGLSAYASNIQLRGDKIDVSDFGDQVYQENLDKFSDGSFRPDATFGAYLYNKDFFVGFSAIQLLGMDYPLDAFEAEDAEEIRYTLARHVYFTAGYDIQLDKSYVLIPSTMLTYTPFTPMLIDVNLTVEYQQKLSAGLTYRHDDAIGIILGGKIQQLFIGYSYDIVTGDLRNEQSGSHEILLAFDIYTRQSRAMYQRKTNTRQIRKRVR